MKVNAQNPATMSTAASPKGAAQAVAGLGKKESVGDVANRVANSSVGAQGRAVQGQGNPKLDKDAFFKLMLTHIKNQDPTSPLKSHEMAAQLAQFSSLEQMSNINEVLKDMNKGQTATGQYQALDLIGKTISGDSSRIDHAKGDKQHPVSFSLNEPAQTVKVAIRDGEGKIVKSFELQDQPRGAIKLDWDGKNLEGRELPAGSYKVQVEAQNVAGNKTAVDMKFKGQVTGIQFTEKGPIVSIGNKQIPLKEIKQIEIAEEKKSTQGGVAASPVPQGLMGQQSSSIPSAQMSHDSLAALMSHKLNNKGI